MRKAYYIECKTFVDSGHGFNMMAADMGTMPTIATSKKQAEKRYQKMIETYNNLLNYKTTKEYTKDEIGVGICLAKTELHHNSLGHITFISLYEIWI